MGAGLTGGGAAAATVNAPRAAALGRTRLQASLLVSIAPGRARQWEGQGAGHVPPPPPECAGVSWRPGGMAGVGAELLRGWSRRGEKALSVRVRAAAAARAARPPLRRPRAPSKGGDGGVRCPPLPRGRAAGRGPGRGFSPGGSFFKSVFL